MRKKYIPNLIISGLRIHYIFFPIDHLMYFYFWTCTLTYNKCFWIITYCTVIVPILSWTYHFSKYHLNMSHTFLDLLTFLGVLLLQKDGTAQDTLMSQCSIYCLVVTLMVSENEADSRTNRGEEAYFWKHRIHTDKLSRFC